MYGNVYKTGEYWAICTEVMDITAFLRAHGIHESVVSDSDSDGKSELDEDYYRYLPAPIPDEQLLGNSVNAGVPNINEQENPPSWMDSHGDMLKEFPMLNNVTRGADIKAKKKAKKKSQIEEEKSEGINEISNVINSEQGNVSLGKQAVESESQDSTMLNNVTCEKGTKAKKKAKKKSQVEEEKHGGVSEISNIINSDQENVSPGKQAVESESQDTTLLNNVACGKGIKAKKKTKQKSQIEEEKPEGINEISNVINSDQGNVSPGKQAVESESQDTTLLNDVACGKGIKAKKKTKQKSQIEEEKQGGNNVISSDQGNVSPCKQEVESEPQGSSVQQKQVQEVITIEPGKLLDLIREEIRKELQRLNIEQCVIKNEGVPNFNLDRSAAQSLPSIPQAVNQSPTKAVKQKKQKNGKETYLVEAKKIDKIFNYIDAADKCLRAIIRKSAAADPPQENGHRDDKLGTVLEYIQYAQNALKMLPSTEQSTNNKTN